VAYKLAKVWTPDNYQDGRKALGYFEGWYFKIVGEGGAHPMALIAGVAMPKDAEHYAFVQFNEAGGRTGYREYAIDEFSFDPARFDLRFGPNRFTETDMRVALDTDTGSVTGEMTFGAWSRWPVRPLSPGIMGWYRFVPFMECYHGILSMDHTLSGTLSVDGRRIAFDGGRGYAEKDWGRSFPRDWVWVQCNGFEREGVSLVLSVARIPWLGSSFVGVIAGLLVDGELYRFATYTGARLDRLHEREDGVDVSISDRRHTLTVAARGTRPGTLRSPVLGRMSGTTAEAIDGSVHVRLARGDGTVVFDGMGRATGIELMDPERDLERGAGGR
jgi:tocopherol cyclase